MRIFFHDYGRYSFTLDLAKELAARGHSVAYAYSDLDTVRADLESARSENLSLAPVRGGESLAKSSFFKRYKSEVRHGEIAAEAIRQFKPNVVLSGNAPLEAQWRMMAGARAANARFVYWMQDFLSAAARAILPKKLGPVGSFAASHFERLEQRMTRDSDHVVVITPDFSEVLSRWGVSDRKITVIENWAPVLPLPDPSEVSRWRAEHGLTEKRVLLYSGTLGIKHRPELIWELAKRVENNDQVRLVVIAEGSGIDWLKEQKGEGQPNLLLLPFQPFRLLPVTLGAADALVVLLEEDAGAFCVPSKTLTYMRAGRPILAGMPPSNLASQILTRNGIGVVVPPADVDGFVAAGLRLIESPEEAAQMGANALAYSARTFHLPTIADRFEALLRETVSAA